MKYAKQIRAALEAKRDEAQVAWAAFEAKRAELPEEGYDPEKDAPIVKAATELKTTYDALDAEAKDLFEQYEKALELEGVTPPSKDSPFGDDDDKGGEKDLTPGEMFTRSPELKALMDSGVLMMEKGRIHTNPVKVLSREETQALLQVKTLLTGGGAPGTQLLRNERLPGIMPLLQAPLQITDLVSVGATDANVIEWVRQSAIANNAAEVAEATATTGTSGTKPESGMTFVVESTTVRTIAHWIPSTKQALQDMPQLRTLVDSMLVDGVARRLNSEVLQGDGVAPNLLGLLNTPGIGSVARTTEPNVEAIYKGILACRLAFFEPNAVVLHPNNWTAIRLSRDDSGAGAGTGGYLFGPPSIPGADTLWGLRVVQDTTMPANTALVGQFNQGILYVRDGVSVIATDSHSDFFVRNLVAILAEGRYAFTVPRPQAFCKVTALA
jgi:HK97 family phage major capsid protein